MTSEIRCKRIIDGKTYNTETATFIGFFEDDEGPGIEESLFKTRHGAFFLHLFDPDRPDERIKPLRIEEAQKWVEEKCPAMYEDEFGEAPEAGHSEARVTLRIPESLRQRIAKRAEERNQSLNAWILRCLERCASADDKAAS